MRTDMTRERVLTLIDAYGGDPARWPEREREAALAMMSGDVDLARAAEEAARLDMALDALPAPLPNPSLRVALKEIPERSGGVVDLIAGWFGLWRPAAGLAAAAVLGIIVGVTNPDIPVPGLETASVEQNAEADIYSLAAASAAGFANQDIY